MVGWTGRLVFRPLTRSSADAEIVWHASYWSQIPYCCLWNTKVDIFFQFFTGLPPCRIRDTTIQVVIDLQVAILRPILSCTKPIIGPILWGHSGRLCHALSLLSSSSLLLWTSMRRQRATVATPGEWHCGVRRLAVANGPNIFQMLLVYSFSCAMWSHPRSLQLLTDGRADVMLVAYARACRAKNDIRCKNVGRCSYFLDWRAPPVEWNVLVSRHLARECDTFIEPGSGGGA